MSSSDDLEEAPLVQDHLDINRNQPAGYGATSSVPDNEEDDEIQDGVRQIEAVSRTWTKTALVVAYMRYVLIFNLSPQSIPAHHGSNAQTSTTCSIFLMAFTTSLEGQVTYALTTYAVSSFNNHSLLSTVYVVQSVVNGNTACSRTPASRPAKCPKTNTQAQPSSNLLWPRLPMYSADSRHSPYPYSYASWATS